MGNTLIRQGKINAETIRIYAQGNDINYSVSMDSKFKLNLQRAFRSGNDAPRNCLPGGTEATVGELGHQLINQLCITHPLMRCFQRGEILGRSQVRQWFPFAFNNWLDYHKTEAIKPCLCVI